MARDGQERGVHALDVPVEAREHHAGRGVVERGAELGAGPQRLGTGVLVEPPGDRVGGAQGEDEAAVHAGPEERVAAVRVHRRRGEHAHDGVVQDDVEEGQAVRDPLLEEGAERDDDEEVEVRLGLAVPEVHDHRGGRQQREAAGGGTPATLHVPPGRERGECDDRRDVAQPVDGRVTDTNVIARRTGTCAHASASSHR